MSFNFSQAGFEEGASVTGMFSGDDLDADGQLSSFDGEITDFMMEWSGNSLAASFTAGIDSLFGLVYDLDNGPLGDGLALDIEGIGVVNSFFFGLDYAAGPGPIGICDGVSSCGIVQGASFSTQLVAVTPKDAAQTPEPFSWVGLIGIGTAAVLKSKRNSQAMG